MQKIYFLLGKSSSQQFLNSIRRAKLQFKKQYFNDNDTYYYAFTRYHFGSLAAFLLATYNLFQIRQNIYKHAIYLVKSNKPVIVKPAIAFVGLFYFAALLAVWHIPSFGAQSAMRSYYATENAVTSYIISAQQINQRLLNEQNIEKILKEV